MGAMGLPFVGRKKTTDVNKQQLEQLSKEVEQLRCENCQLREKVGAH